MVRAVEPRLEIAESAVNMQRLSRGQLQRVAVVGQSGFGIAFPAIRVNFTARFHMGRKKMANRKGVGPLRHRPPQPPSFLQTASPLVGKRHHFYRAKDQRAFFILGNATSGLPADRPANNDLIRCHTPAAPRPLFINHAAAQPVEQIPSRLIAATHLPLELGAAQAWGMCGDPVSGPKPLAERKVVAVKEGSGRNESLLATCGAFVNRPPSFDPILPAGASWTNKASGTTALPQIISLRPLIQEHQLVTAVAWVVLGLGFGNQF